MRIIFAGLLIAATASLATADDWHNNGGNAQRNGQSTDIGPDLPDQLWSGAPSSIIAWQPVIEGNRVFVVRQTGFPPEGEPEGSPIFAFDLTTGEQLWRADLPFRPEQWTTWIAGVRDGQLYAARSANGNPAPLYALDVATGATIWVSDDDIQAFAYDGVVFAPNGDPIVGEFQTIRRISAVDGSTVWESPRSCSVSGNCGGALYGDSFYVADAAAGGHVLVRFDLSTGAELYVSEILPGFTLQNSPFVGPDGTVYLARVQNNPTVDFFYALRDTGTEFTIKWDVPAGWTTSSEFGIGPDGSVYMMTREYALARLDPETGAVQNSSAPLSGFSKPRMAVDAAGRVYLSNGAFATGRVYAFNADCTERWSVAIPNINIGGPALGNGGTLVVAGIGGTFRAFRTPRGDMNCDGSVDGFDIDPFALALTDKDAYEATYPACEWDYADINADGAVNGFDIDPFVLLLTGK